MLKILNKYVMNLYLLILKVSLCLYILDSKALFRRAKALTMVNDVKEQDY